MSSERGELSSRSPGLGTRVIFATVLALGGCAVPGSRDQESPPTLLLHECRVLAMTEPRARPEASVLLAGDTIARVGPSRGFRTADADSVIPCQGRTVMPGLVDAHVHVADTTELLLYLKHGVTTVFNLGGDYVDLFADERLSILELRSAVESGTVPGPTIYTAGTSLDGTPATGPFQRALGSPSEASRVVRDQATAGYDFIKVYDAISDELLAAVVATADSAGLPVFGHVPNSLSVTGAIESGIDVITHAEEFWQHFSDAPERSELAALAQAVARSGIAVIPNTAFIRRLVLQLQDLEAQLARPDVRHLHPRVRVWWDPQYNYYVNRDDPEGFERAMSRRYEWLIPFVTELHEAGVPLLAGSDASVPVALPGAALIEEVEEFVKAGLAPFEALKAATSSPADLLRGGVGASFGRLESGARADLIILAEDPLASVAALRSLEGVIVRGRWLSRGELDQMLEAATRSFAR